MAHNCRMDNSGQGPLQVPGFGGIPLQQQLPHEERFAHGMMEWRQNTPITEHELQMVRAMNLITDVHNWHSHVFDEIITAVWREITRTSYPLITERAWEWCRKELRDKATDFHQTGFVRVLDTGSVVCKGDRLISTQLLSEMATATRQLFTKSRSTSERGQIDVIDPHMYPLVFGRTRVFRDGGITCLSNLFGTGNATQSAASLDCSQKFQAERDAAMRRVRSGNTRNRFWSGDIHDPRAMLTNWKSVDYMFSPNFQCLPSDVELVGGKISIVSYINNLHPKHAAVYSHIEKLISLAIEPWNACLVKGQYLPNSIRRDAYNSGRPQVGRVPSRIPFFGLEWVNELPFLALSFNQKYPGESISQMDGAEGCCDEIKAQLARKDHPGPKPIYLRNWVGNFREFTEEIPKPTVEAWKWAEEYLLLPDSTVANNADSSSLPSEWQSDAWHLIAKKALARMRLFSRHDLVPDPNMTLSYEDWRAGRLNNPLMATMFMRPIEEDSWHCRHRGWRVRGRSRRVYSDRFKRTAPERLAGPYYRGPSLDRYSVCLQDHLQKTGLQVIVKIGGIELSPDNPQHDCREWSVQGFLNEHIVATAMVAVEVDNITACSVEFRQETSLPWGDDDNWHELYPDNRFHPSMTTETSCGPVRAQKIGEVQMKEGRMIAFPNVMEHRLSSFQLVDSTRTGHIRFITLYLIDPNYRICSTRNVPAQQHEWWAEEVEDLLLHQGLPPELCQMITTYCTDSPVSHEQALQDRLDLKEELELVDTVRFCEID